MTNAKTSKTARRFVVLTFAGLTALGIGATDGFGIRASLNGSDARISTSPGHGTATLALTSRKAGGGQKDY